MAESRIVDISGIIEPFKERVVTLRATAAANPYALDAAIMINECLCPDCGAKMNLEGE